MAVKHVLQAAESWIQKSPDVCGGEACIRDTRIPVWSVVAARNLGASDDQLRSYFVTPLSPADLRAAFGYYEEHAQEIDEDIRQNEDA